MEYILRICHLVSGDLWAGAEVMACYLLKGLHLSSDVDLSVILLNEGRLADELRSAGVKVDVVDEAQHSFIGLVSTVRSILSNNPPHIIHAHRYKENILAWLASRGLSACQLITTQHGLPESHNEKVSLPGRMKSGANFYLLKHRYRKVVAVSDDIGAFFSNKLKFSPERVAVVHNGIEIPPAVNRNSDQDVFLIGSSGRLFPVKDYPLMVHVAAALRGAPEVSFALAGDGPERGPIKELIDQYGLGGAFVLEGHLDDMDSFYQKLDVYINTSIHEGIPMTILEAMAHGLPVIAPRVGGIPEVITDGVDGFLIDSREPAAFAEKCRLLERDRGLYRRMSVAAREKAVGAFSVERMVGGYLGVYREVLSLDRMII